MPVDWPKRFYEAAVARGQGYVSPEVRVYLLLHTDGFPKSAEEVRDRLNLDDTPETFDANFFKWPEGEPMPSKGEPVQYVILTISQYYKLLEFSIKGTMKHISVDDDFIIAQTIDRLKTEEELAHEKLVKDEYEKYEEAILRGEKVKFPEIVLADQKAQMGQNR